MGITGKISGDRFLVYLDDVAIAASNSATLNLSHSARDITTKDSNRSTERAKGLKDWSVDVEGLVAFDESKNFTDLKSLWDNGTVVQVKFSTEASGDEFYIGNAIISDLSMETPQYDNATFSATFEADGPLNTKTQS
jgi:predicted secreted protein